MSRVLTKYENSILAVKRGCRVAEPQPLLASAAYESVWSDLQGVPFSQGYLDAGGVRTRYLHAGDPGRPALVFLHGSGGHAEAYVRNLEAH
ncbi:MAG: 2-hydroxy-6-oxonona-2,4-dienedioate hydrolase, partial [Mycobacterium sp.]|nr:2-hydroxy-6-oxonona-2,4-dienedioate hydrolase [Mycobacterium sp.]